MDVVKILAKYPILNSDWCFICQRSLNLYQYLLDNRVIFDNQHEQYTHYADVREYFVRVVSEDSCVAGYPINIDPWNRKFPEYPSNWIPIQNDNYYSWVKIEDQLCLSKVAYIYTTTVEKTEIYCCDLMVN